MSAGPLVALFDGAAELCRDATPPADPFEGRALADAALVLTGDLLDLVSRIHDHRRDLYGAWAALEPDRTPPPPPPPPPPTSQADPKGDGRGGGFPPPPPPGGRT